VLPRRGPQRRRDLALALIVALTLRRLERFWLRAADLVQPRQPVPPGHAGDKNEMLLSIPMYSR
jgi:hypothetical protein